MTAWTTARTWASEVLTSTLLNTHLRDNTNHLHERTPEQVVFTQSGVYRTGSTTMPFDNSIPQSGEGNEFTELNTTITPTSATNYLYITVTVFGSFSVSGQMMAALFQDSNANALAAGWDVIYTNGYPFAIRFTHRMVAGTTSATTFKVRVGSNSAGSVYLNGYSAGVWLGGVLASSMRVEESPV